MTWWNPLTWARRDNPSNPRADVLNAWAWGKPTAAGIRVTEESALRQDVVFACIRILAEDVAKLPLHLLLKKRPRGAAPAEDHPLYRVLHDQPNPEMTAMTFWETFQQHLGGWGNGYAEIVFDRGGRVAQLWPLLPHRTTPFRDKDTGELKYAVETREGNSILPAYRVLHVPFMPFDGITGRSPIQLARERIAKAQAVEEYGARFFANGATPPIALQHPLALSEEAVTRLRRDFEERHMGLENAHRVAILEEGLDIKEIGVHPNDAQMVESEKLSPAQIARFWRMPLHKVLDYEHATYSNVEHLGIEYVVDTILPWVIRKEQAIWMKLLSAEEQRQGYYAKHRVDGLLRGDTQTRFAAYGVARQWGWMSANDVLELEDRNPLPGDQGDIYMVPLNMIPADQLVEQAAAASAARAMRLLDAPSVPGIQPVESRSPAGRRQIRGAWQRVFVDDVTRVVRREEADVMRGAQRMLEQRDADTFFAWLREFYREHEAFVSRSVLAAFMGYAEAVQVDAAAEVAAAAEMTPALQEFVRTYVDSFAGQYCGSSQGQLEQIVRKAIASGEDIVPLLQARFDEWKDARPDKVANRQVVQLSDAVATEVWRSHGITKLKWRASGKNCPYCSHLDGRTVGIDDSFLKPGEELTPEGATSPLTTYFHVRHAPAHRGCDCTVSPSR